MTPPHEVERAFVVDETVGIHLPVRLGAPLEGEVAEANRPQTGEGVHEHPEPDLPLRIRPRAAQIRQQLSVGAFQDPRTLPARSAAN
jgi:hypothetical protein